VRPGVAHSKIRLAIHTRLNAESCVALLADESFCRLLSTATGKPRARRGVIARITKIQEAAQFQRCVVASGGGRWAWADAAQACNVGEALTSGNFGFQLSDRALDALNKQSYVLFIWNEQNYAN
jgi:hypothetical protein